MKHTQLPWKYTYDNDTGNKDEYFIEFFTLQNDATIPGDEGIGRIEKSEDAEFIVAACNNYDNFMELLNVTKSMLADAMDRDECYDEITEEMFDDFKALTEAINKCEGR